MRTTASRGIWLAAAALVVPIAALPAHASGDPSAAARGTSSSTVARSDAPTAGTCYDQHVGDGTTGIASQNFQPRLDSYDSRGADDFTLQAPCTVKQVLVDGLYGLGHATVRSMHVTFYRNDDGTPGQVISGQLRAPFRESRVDQTFFITLLRPVTLQAGHYWVSVKANMNSTLQWGWFWLTNKTVRGLPSQWRNGGDGFGTGCTTYTETTTCFAPGHGDGDFSFALKS